MARLTGRALRVTIFIEENDIWHHRPLYTEIVHRAHKAGLAGVSVFRGIEGFGASSLIHTSRASCACSHAPRTRWWKTSGSCRSGSGGRRRS